MTEEWKDIEGFHGHYQVSNFGGARSVDRVVSDKRGDNYFIGGKTLIPIRNNNGYVKILARYGSVIKQLMMHRLVAIYFIPNPDNLPEVNHKDKNKANNHIENLEWTSLRENRTHSKMNVKRTSIYTGVSKRGNRWIVRLCLDKTIIPVGSFTDEIEASRAYKQALTERGLTNKYATL